MATSKTAPVPAESVDAANDQKTRDRSPNHPAIDLEKSLELATKLEEKVANSFCNVTVVAGYWEMKLTSSGFMRSLGALEQFGLIESSGSGSARAVKLMDSAKRIIRDARPDSADRLRLIQSAALLPPIHKKVWEHYAGSLPDDATFRFDLEMLWKFTKGAAPDFIHQIKRTIQFAKLAQPDSFGVEAQGDGEQRKDGNATGLPSGEMAPGVQSATQATPSVNSRNVTTEPSLEKTMRQDIFSLSEGPVTIQWPTPLSAESIQDLQDWLKIVERKIARADVLKAKSEA